MEAVCYFICFLVRVKLRNSRFWWGGGGGWWFEEAFFVIFFEVGNGFSGFCFFNLIRG